MKTDMTATGGVGFTPGPWKFVPAGGTTAYKDDGADMGCFIGADGTQVCHFGDETTYYPSNGFPPNEADARLIAAAPELYTFAQELALGAYTLDEVANRARELIAKATTP